MSACWPRTRMNSDNLPGQAGNAEHEDQNEGVNMAFDARLLAAGEEKE